MRGRVLASGGSFHLCSLVDRHTCIPVLSLCRWHCQHMAWMSTGEYLCSRKYIFLDIVCALPPPPFRSLCLFFSFRYCFHSLAHIHTTASCHQEKKKPEKTTNHIAQMSSSYATTEHEIYCVCKEVKLHVPEGKRKHVYSYFTLL